MLDSKDMCRTREQKICVCVGDGVQTDLQPVQIMTYSHVLIIRRPKNRGQRKIEITTRQTKSERRLANAKIE